MKSMVVKIQTEEDITPEDVKMALLDNFHMFHPLKVAEYKPRRRVCRCHAYYALADRYCWRCGGKIKEVR